MTAPDLPVGASPVAGTGVAPVAAGPSTPQDVPHRGGPVNPSADALAARFPEADADRQDGLRLSWAAERKWAHLRPSGTEPIVRVICEAPTRQEAAALVEALRAALPA